MSRRGFSLVEVMVSSAIGVVVIAGAVAGGMGMQSLSLAQEQRMVAQQSLRAASDLLTLEFQKAGSGLGNVRLNLGGTVTQGAVAVTSAATFSTDSTFEAPSGDYAGLVSDSLVLYSGRTSALVSLACCPGVSLGVCGSCRVRDGNSTCAAVNASGAFTSGQSLVYVNQTLGLACAQTVNATPNSDRIVSSSGLLSLGAPAIDDPCNDLSSFWCSAGTYAMQLDAVALRVNWKATTTGGAQRPRLQLDPDGPYGPAPWQDLLWDVERLQVRQMTDDLTAPGTFSFYPDATAGRPALDQCTTSTCVVAGGLDVKDTALGVGLSTNDALKLQLQRRLRGVEVTLLARTGSADGTLLDRSEHGFRTDAHGLFKDGFSRRRVVFQVAPRNFGLTEVSP